MSQFSSNHHQRPISTADLSHDYKLRLAENGYETVADVLSTEAADLSLELDVSLDQAQAILRALNTPQSGPSKFPSSSLHAQSSQAQPHNVSQLLTAESNYRFSTLSDPLDQIIGHFVEDQSLRYPVRKGKERAGQFASITPGTSVEISGPPGSGKTALAIALALSARFRLRRDDEEQVEDADSELGEVLLVDTEGSIPPERLKRAAECLTRNLEDSPFDVISGIYLMRVATQVQLIALLQTLDDWLRDHPKVNLVIFDTLSFHLRQPNIDMRTRSRLLELIKQQIGKAITIVVTNQLATKLLTAENKPANFDTGDRAVLMPQLGDLWTTSKTVRLILFRGGKSDERRYAHASSIAGNKHVPWARFDIDHDGLPCNPIDVDDNDLSDFN